MCKNYDFILTCNVRTLDRVVSELGALYPSFYAYIGLVELKALSLCSSLYYPDIIMVGGTIDKVYIEGPVNPNIWYSFHNIHSKN